MGKGASRRIAALLFTEREKDGNGGNAETIPRRRVLFRAGQARLQQRRTAFLAGHRPHDGQEHADWKADEKEGCIVIEHAQPYHEYTVSFLAHNVWDSTQMYNYITNGWDTDKHSPYDPRYPLTAAHIKEVLKGG